VLTTATVDTAILEAVAVHADTCSFTLSARSPNRNLWDAIPRDIDTIRRKPFREIDAYCQRLATEAQHFSQQVRDLLSQRKLVIIEPIKQEIRGQRGRTNGLAMRAAERFPFAPRELVQKSLSFQMAVHDHALSAHQPTVEKPLVDELLRRVHNFWRDYDAHYGRQEVSLADKLLFATAAANAIMIENGAQAYGNVVLVSRDLQHVYRMYHHREELLRPVCKRMRLLYPRNFLFRPTLQTVV
jgi:hypothetical protein